MPSGQSNEFPMLINGIKCYSLTDHDQLEAVHKEALLAAKIHHERVREQALLVFLNNRLQGEQQKLLDIKRQEEKRLKLEQEQAELAAQVAELQRRKIEATIVPTVEHVKPTPPRPNVRPKTIIEPAATETVVQGATKLEKELETGLGEELEKELTKQKAREELDAKSRATVEKIPSPPTTEHITRSQGVDNKHPAFQVPQSARESIQPQDGASKPAQKPDSTVAITAPVTKPVEISHLVPGAQEYLEIHKRLKQLRRFMTETAKQHPELKKKMGEGRREIRKSVGQLTEGKAGTNKVPVSSCTGKDDLNLLII